MVEDDEPQVGMRVLSGEQIAQMFGGEEPASEQEIERRAVIQKQGGRAREDMEMARTLMTSLTINHFPAILNSESRVKYFRELSGVVSMAVAANRAVLDSLSDSYKDEMKRMLDELEEPDEH
jgi:hypothetical protein